MTDDSWHPIGWAPPDVKLAQPAPPLGVPAIVPHVSRKPTPRSAISFELRVEHGGGLYAWMIQDLHGRTHYYPELSAKTEAEALALRWRAKDLAQGGLAHLVWYTPARHVSDPFS